MRKSEKQNHKYAYELQGVLNYMVDILVNEFPTDVFTPYHLMMSILDTKDCHANILLDNLLSDDDLKEIKDACLEKLEKNIQPTVKSIEKGKQTTVEFDFHLNKILDRAENEMDKTGAKLLGTEHTLLAILNNDNSIKIRYVLNKVGINYQTIFDKCKTEKADTTPHPKKLKPIGMLGAPATPTFAFKDSTDILTAQSDEYISKYTINLNDEAVEGKFDAIIGRDKEIHDIVRILARRKKNNVILVGEGGVGKTAIVQKLAMMIANGQVPPILEGKEIVQLDIIKVVSGTNFRGMFEERVRGIFDELKSSKKYILFIDDIQNALKNGSKDRDADITSVIGDILSGGEVSVIGTTTFKGYRNSIESNPLIARKIQKVIIEEPTIKEAVDILRQSKEYYEDYHNVTFTNEAIEKAVELSKRYITDRSLPDSAFDVIDLVGANANVSKEDPQELKDLKDKLNKTIAAKENAMNTGYFEDVDSYLQVENALKGEIADFNRSNAKELNERTKVDVQDILQAVSNISNVPISSLNVDDKKKLANIDTILKQNIIGQDDAIETICQAIKRKRIGLGDKSKPNAYLLIGQSGVGKSLLAKQLAKEIYGSENDLVRIDMSEYSEKNSTSKLIGAAPGYVGYDNGGQLTEAIKNKPHCVLLLDEIEKADKEVYNLFLQLFDEGRLTDSSGQLVNFKNVIIIMTSNIGTKEAAEMSGGIGFAPDSQSNEMSIYEKALKKQFTPEFLNRIDKIVFFNNLSDDNMKKISILELNKLSKRLNDINFKLKYNDSVVEYIKNEAEKQKGMGARPIGRTIQFAIEDQITDMILNNDYAKNYEFSATCENNKLIVR